MIISQKHSTRKRLFLLKTLAACILLVTTFGNGLAQTSKVKKTNTGGGNNELITLKDRWAFKTNAVDWLLTIPNVGVEFDLGNTLRSKHSLNFNLKWNWQTSHSYTPDLIFNLFDTRLEWRQYFRTRQRNGFTQNADAWTWLNEHVFTTLRRNPRDHRAYYWGIYANYASFNIKFGKEGKQGTSYGAGVNLGFTTPLYGYKNGAIDLEIGGAIGLLFSKYDTYWHDIESNCYPILANKSKMVPYPVVTDLRVAFVYRFMSVSTKYKQSAERRVDIRNAAKKAIEQQIYQMRERIDSIDHAVRKAGGTGPDSLLNKEELKQWHLMQKERRAQALQEAEQKLRKQVADSLGIQLTDSTTKTHLKQIDKAIKLRNEQKKVKVEAVEDSVKISAKESKRGKKAKVDKKTKNDEPSIREKKSKKEEKTVKEKKESGKDKKKKKSDKTETALLYRQMTADRKEGLT